MLFYEIVHSQEGIKIQKFLNKLTEAIDPNLHIKVSFNFESYVFTKVVMFGLNNFTADREERVEQVKLSLIESGFDYTKYCMPQTFSFFHEIGHIITGQQYDNFEFTLAMIKYQQEVDMVNESDLTPLEKDSAYNLLSLELEANEWALNFVAKNQKIIKEYEKEIIPLLTELFKALE